MDTKIVKCFVWEGVLEDHTPGMVVVLAHSKTEALKILERTDEAAYKECLKIKPQVTRRPQAWISYGGG